MFSLTQYHWLGVWACGFAVPPNKTNAALSQRLAVSNDDELVPDRNSDVREISKFSRIWFENGLRLWIVKKGICVLVGGEDERRAYVIWQHLHGVLWAEHLRPENSNDRVL